MLARSKTVNMFSSNSSARSKFWAAKVDVNHYFSLKIDYLAGQFQSKLQEKHSKWKVFGEAD
jgi:hypothetical protein